MTLIEFLLARIAEDEAVAREVESAWVQNPALEVCNDVGEWRLPGITGTRRGVPYLTMDYPRVLTECEAKRRIMDELDTASRQHYTPFEEQWKWCPAARADIYGEEATQPEGPCDCPASWSDYKRAPMLRLLALPYADHPDYRPDWTV
jgi:hypothetical protein